MSVQLLLLPKAMVRYSTTSANAQRYTCIMTVSLWIRNPTYTTSVNLRLLRQDMKTRIHALPPQRHYIKHELLLGRVHVKGANGVGECMN